MSNLLPRSVIARAVGRRAEGCEPSLVRECEGFRVQTELGTLGVVERVLFDQTGEPSALVVCRGFFRLREVTVPAGAITSIDPVGRALVAGGWRNSRSEGVAAGA